MSLTTKARAIFDDAIGNIEGWADDVKTDLPAALDEIDKIEADPLYQAVKGLSGGKYAGMALSFLTDLGKMAEQDLATVPAPAEPADDATPAEPDEATAEATAEAAAAPQVVRVAVPAAGTPTPVGG